jgi:hypothetical protein
MTATADQQAAQNRLTIRVNVRFTNKKKKRKMFEKSFTFFYDSQNNNLPAGHN